MIVRQHLDACTDVAWATPTSGYGHLADEQPLPYIHRNGVALTPLFGGEHSQPGCEPYTAGLPYGRLAGDWPACQRRFNWFRKSVNLYWRYLFQSRTRSDKEFLFLEQLNFRHLGSGFEGRCPLLLFQREFVIGGSSIAVNDTIRFLMDVNFSSFVPLCVPLFTDWAIGDSTSSDLPRLELADAKSLHVIGEQRSAAGRALLWVERMGPTHFVAGNSLRRSYTYRWGN